MFQLYLIKVSNAWLIVQMFSVPWSDRGHCYIVSYRIFFSAPRYHYKTEKDLETHVALRSYICHQMSVANLKIALTSFSLWRLVAGEQGFTHN